ncbi:hypothetical protein R1sor_004728 [Riccia sorocarpa]|uniref:Uncharacterized protein n=1 Tax=Riccia sorocarpa TaxID=122646 RepID=A0ABD3HL12_9MARC
MKLTHIDLEKIVTLVRAYNPITDRIILTDREDILSDSMIADVFNLPLDGVAVLKNPVFPPEWLECCYPEYANLDRKGKEYYAAVRCEDPEWRNRISWVLRFVLGRAEGREVSKGVLAAMVQAEMEGKTVNWAAVITDRLRGELKRLKGIRKGDFLKCEAGPQLTMVAEYVLWMKKTEDKRKVAEAKTVRIPPAPLIAPSNSPSTWTRAAAKRKNTGGSIPPDQKRPKRVQPRRRLVQGEEEDESDDTESESPSPPRVGSTDIGGIASPLPTAGRIEKPLPPVSTNQERTSGNTIDPATQFSYEKALEIVERHKAMQKIVATTGSAISTISQGLQQQSGVVVTARSTGGQSTTPTSRPKTLPKSQGMFKEPKPVVKKAAPLPAVSVEVPIREPVTTGFTTECSPPIPIFAVESTERGIETLVGIISQQQAGTDPTSGITVVDFSPTQGFVVALDDQTPTQQLNVNQSSVEMESSIEPHTSPEKPFQCQHDPECVYEKRPERGGSPRQTSNAVLAIPLTEAVDTVTVTAERISPQKVEDINQFFSWESDPVPVLDTPTGRTTPDVEMEKQHTAAIEAVANTKEPEEPMDTIMLDQETTREPEVTVNADGEQEEPTVTEKASDKQKNRISRQHQG